MLSRAFYGFVLERGVISVNEMFSDASRSETAKNAEKLPRKIARIRSLRDAEKRSCNFFCFFVMMPYFGADSASQRYRERVKFNAGFL